MVEYSVQNLDNTILKMTMINSSMTNTRKTPQSPYNIIKAEIVIQ